MFKLIVIGVLFVFIQGCQSGGVKMSDEQENACHFKAATVKILSQYRDQGYSKYDAVESYMKNDRFSKQPNNSRMEELTRANALSSSRVVYAIPEFKPSTFHYFEYSVCALRMVHNKTIDSSKIEVIRDQILVCQNKYSEGEAGDMLQCVKAVVIAHHI